MPGQEIEKKLTKASKQCRLCGNFSCDVVNIFDFLVKFPPELKINSDHVTVPFVQLINECLNIDVVEKTNLPGQSCKKCYNRLISWYSFKLCCIKQQSQFEDKIYETFNNNNNEKIGVVSDQKPSDINKQQNDVIVKTKEVVQLTEHCSSKNTICEEGNSVIKNSNYNSDQALIIFNNNKSELKNLKKRNCKIKKDDAVYQCDKCSKKFRSKFSIRKHLETHNESRKYCCHICGVLFKTASYLQYHVQLHTGRKQFSCQYCSKEFHQSNHLKQHIRVHTGERPYECTECKERFTRSCQLTQHVLAVHRKVQKYKCDICGKGFLYNTNFKAHMMRHEGQKNAKCDVCNKTFVTKNALFRHQRLHTGDKPFACQECGKRFADCSNRKKHILSHHSGLNSNRGVNAKCPKQEENSKRKSPVIVSSIKTIAPEDAKKEVQTEKPNDNPVTVIKSFIEPSIVLLAPLDLKTDNETRTLENFVNSSDLSYKNGEVYIDLSNIQVVAHNESPSVNSSVSHTQNLTIIRHSNGSSNQEVFKVPSAFINSTSSNADVSEAFQVSEQVQDGEPSGIEIPFPDDIPIFSSLSDNVNQNMAYFIPDKELFNHSEVLTQSIQSENVTFSQIDIESNYLDLVDTQQKTSADVFNAISSCDSQSVMKILNAEGTVLLFPEQGEF